MLKRLAPCLVLLLAPIALACDTATDDLDRDGDAPDVAGKSDAVDGSDSGPSCPADVYVTRAANDHNDHVYSNCHNADTGKFTYKTCCADELELIEDVSGCPAQVRFTDVDDASDKRCMNDVEGHDAYAQFVPTACCAPLCDPQASFIDDGSCRDSYGQYEEEICCIRNFNLTEANCIGAEWELIDGGSRDFACRAPNGQFTFDACCVEMCAQEISTSGQIPEGCNLDSLLADECPSGATPNSGGLCHNPDNGQFVKAVCCELSGDDDGLDIEKSDACWATLESSADCS